MITLLWDKTTEPSPREKYLWCHAPGHDKEWCYWDGIRWIPAGSAPGLIDDDLLSDNIVRKSDLPELLPEYGAKQLYTWIKYADDAYGHGMSDKSEIDGVYKKYIGFAYNKETPEESNLPDDYEWSPISGRDGVGVNSTVYWYIASENNFGVIAPPLYINPETAGWSTKGSDFVLDETLKYLWSFVRVGYTDGDGWQSEPYIVRSFYDFDYAEIQQQVEEDINEALVSVNNRLETVEETDALIKTDKNVGLIKLLTQYKTGERTNFADVIADAAEGVISTQVATAVHNQINTVGTDLNAIDATIKTHATALYGEHGDGGVVGEISSINDDIDALNGEAIRSVARAEAYWEWTGAKKTIIVDGHSYEVLQNENYDYAPKSGVTAIRLIEDQETHESDYETLEQYNARILALGKESDEDPGFELRSTVKSMSAIKQTADNISLIVGDNEQAFGIKIGRIVESNEDVINMVASKVVINSELIANSIKTKALEIYEENPQDPENPLVLAHLGKDGLRASNAEISGRITADSGKIGGFSLNGNSIYSGTGSTAISLNSNINNDYFIIAGADTVSNAKFYVKKDGSFYSTKGKISCFEIDATRLGINADPSYQIGLSSSMWLTESNIKLSTLYGWEGATGSLEELFGIRLNTYPDSILTSTDIRGIDVFFNKPNFAADGEMIGIKCYMANNRNYDLNSTYGLYIDVSGGWNTYGIKVNAANGEKRNYAIWCTDGEFAGLRPHIRYLSTGSAYVNDEDYVVVINSSNGNGGNVYLPSIPKKGATHYIYNLRAQREGQYLRIDGRGNTIYNVREGINETVTSIQLRGLYICTWISDENSWIIFPIYWS